MVFQLQLRARLRISALISVLLSGAACGTLAVATPARADLASAQQYLREARSYYGQEQYFKTARYAFAANEQDSSVRSEAYSWITLGLAHAGLYNAGVYFFIRTLQAGDRTAIRRVLPLTQEFLLRLGPDLIRPYLIRHTSYNDYGPASRSAYLFSLGKEAILRGDYQRAVGYLNAVSSGSRIWPFALELRGTAKALLNQNDDAIADFQTCEKKAEDLPDGIDSSTRYYRQTVREAEDLQARCYADDARTLYQAGRFDEADWTYDRIPKSSIVWPEILFEQAWNSFAQGQYNRSLGKLVSYKSPALSFVFNTEIDVLRAQSYLALCLYQDANQVINDFNSRYANVGVEVKKFVERNQHNIPLFYEVGKRALRGSLYTHQGLYEMANQFVRGPYFQNLVANENQIPRERAAIARFASSQPGVERNGGGFPGFLNQVLGWRLRSIQLLGGIFVKNSYLDYHSALISDFEKMAYIKLEMLKRAKDQLLHVPVMVSDRSRGNVIPTRRDDQMYWEFNGEFWNDELGDYVFGLESECNKPNESNGPNG